jgi:hypothetical protein
MMEGPGKPGLFIFGKGDPTQPALMERVNFSTITVSPRRMPE